MNVAQAMTKCLELEGVKDIFGYPGAAICPFYDALISSTIRHILVRHEQNAAHAASGYARATGKPAVCVATSGPGATNLITGIATAYSDSIPMVVITGQVSTELLGRDVFQEADITGSAEPFVKHSYLVKNPREIPRIFKEAFYIAGSGRPGPVLIDIPVDVQKAEIDFEYPKTVDIRGYKPSIKGHPLQIKRVAEAIKLAKKPIICAGGGVFATDAKSVLVEFAEKYDIPVVTTMMGIGCIPSKHPLHFGMLGTHGKKVANLAINESDLLILIGARVGDRAVTTPGVLEKRTKIIHIDVDPAEIGKNMDAQIPLVGDAKVILGQIIKSLDETDKHTEWIFRLNELKSQEKIVDGTDGINPKRFLQLLSSKADENCIVVGDVGQNQIWTANHFEIKKGRFVTTGGMGTMGYSVGAAIGAKTAKPKKQVFAICGDGSFQMQMMELGTICQHDIPVKIIIMKNNRLGMVRELQKNLYHNNLTAVFLDGSPNFVTIASAYGIKSKSINRLDQEEEAINEMLQCDGPYLLECVINPDEPTL
ncbi:MAG: acetolactate synthase, large subunit [Oscillospiraceae bacterium]|nr:acetolactate synthase, large subunit [Oscillospiraceae bacterium]